MGQTQQARTNPVQAMQTFSRQACKRTRESCTQAAASEHARVKHFDEVCVSKLLFLLSHQRDVEGRVEVVCLAAYGSPPRRQCHRVLIDTDGPRNLVWIQGTRARTGDFFLSRQQLSMYRLKKGSKNMRPSSFSRSPVQAYNVF